MTKKSNSQSAIRNPKSAMRSGSAIILAIVLTSLLAIIGTIFLLSSRVDSIATSAIADNKDLDLAVDTVIARISEELAADVPGVTGNEYYDYPDEWNRWLASLEPNAFGLWPHITDINNQFGVLAYNLNPVIIPDYQNRTDLRNSTSAGLFPADADGDGVSDSAWIQLPGKTSGKGKPVYAAVRVIDNGAMLNVNTGFKFDPCNIGLCDGSTQMQINLMALSWRPTDPCSSYDSASENDLLGARSPILPYNFTGYEQNVLWQYGNPDSNYMPFDISDELEMRYRYLINQGDIATRLETLGETQGRVWNFRFAQSRTPFANLNDWFVTANADTGLDPNYAYRHIATIHNLDRITNPAGGRMVNVNTALAPEIYDAVRAALVDAGATDVNRTTAYLTANLIDYTDGRDYDPLSPRYDPNDDVTVIYDNGNPCFGFETPCVYISEIAQSYYKPDPNDPNFDPNFPDRIYRSYAIELFKPYWEDEDPNGWWLLIDNPANDYNIPILWSGSRRFHVMAAIDPLASIDINLLNDVPGPNEANLFDPNQYINPVAQTVLFDFNSESRISLRRYVNGSLLEVDVVYVFSTDVNGNGWDPNSFGYVEHGFERDIRTIHRCIRQVWAPYMTFSPTIGYMNVFVGEDYAPLNEDWTYKIQAHPANRPLTNVGEIGRLFRESGYLSYYSPAVAMSAREYDRPDPYYPFGRPGVRVDLEMPEFQHLFNYLTVFDPNESRYGGHPDTETRIKGRININTAPWFVLAQLPWISQKVGDPTVDYRLAQAITGHRETFGAFKNTGQLMDVRTSADDPCRIDLYALNGIDEPNYPDLTYADGAADDFEERDAIFARISNLVTVRSDVFTAYILVRIDKNGPQKRVVAILDRSEYPLKPVKVLAIQQVPDPR